MSTRQRKAEDAPKGRIVKASISVRTDLHARWAAGSAMAGMSRNAFAVIALTEALKGIVIHDRRKPVGQASLSDRLDSPGEITPDADS